MTAFVHNLNDVLVCRSPLPRNLPGEPAQVPNLVWMGAYATKSDLYPCPMMPDAVHSNWSAASHDDRKTRCQCSTKERLPCNPLHFCVSPSTVPHWPLYPSGVSSFCCFTCIHCFSDCIHIIQTVTCKIHQFAQLVSTLRNILSINSHQVQLIAYQWGCTCTADYELTCMAASNELFWKRSQQVISIKIHSSSFRNTLNKRHIYILG